MTVIAYKSGILAADTQTTNGSRKLYGIQKVFETPSFLVGIAGAAPLIDPFLSWFLKAELLTVEDGCTPIDMHYLHPIDFDGEDVEAVVVCRASLSVWHVEANGQGISLGIDRATALGSGEEYALGAMAAGATAEQAVVIASEFDPFSGGGVCHLCVKPMPKKNVVLVK